MNLRLQAHGLVATTRTALRSGEWIPADGAAATAADAIDAALAGICPSDALDDLVSDLAGIVIDAIEAGDWIPGAWVPEWRSYRLAA